MTGGLVISAAGKRAQLSAQELGQLTDKQLDAIRRCVLCLEPYERCRCREGRIRRKLEAAGGAGE